MCRLSGDVPRQTAGSSQCPFTIRKLDEATWLIREHDPYGEIPHIYARLHSMTDTQGLQRSVIIVTDTGVGTKGGEPDKDGSPRTEWTIRSFLDHHLNVHGDIPYLVILSHCHWDHILGLHSLLAHDRHNVLVCASACDPSFLGSPEKLDEHSLCKANSKTPPNYETSIWAPDLQQLTYRHPTDVCIQLPVITIHTPGHTPDSLSWFDTETRMLYVGDSLYQQESNDSINARWGREQPGPVMFTNEANLYDWWRSIEKLQSFVRKENISGKQPVKLASGHVTSSVDALSCLGRMKAFMARVLRGEVPFVAWPDNRGKPMGHWTDDRDHVEGNYSEFSVGAPIFVVETGRRTIPRDEWVLE